MRKARKRLATGLIVSCLCSLFAAGICAAPLYARARVDAATNTAGRNADLIVRYAMDEVSGGKLKAQKWDAANGVYVADASMDATVSGTVTTTAGIEGTHGAEFGKDAYAVAAGKLNASGASGITVTAWVKDLTADWGSLIEVYDGSNGGRFGKSTIGSNTGTLGNEDWGRRQYPGAGANFSNGGDWNSFVAAGDGADPMTGGQWYFVAFTLTSNSLLHYRGDKLKISYPKSGGDEKASQIITSIWNAVNGGNASFALRGSWSNNLPAGDKIDDFRIYKGAMDADTIKDVYREYQATQSLNTKTLHSDDSQVGSVEAKINNAGCDVLVSDLNAAFPKLLIGNVNAGQITENSGVFSYNGAGYSYSYTVSGTGAAAKATVVYTEAQYGQAITFEVSKKLLPVYLTDLKMAVNGGSAVTIEGFNAGQQSYSITLSPDVGIVVFSGTPNGSSTCNFSGAVNYNGDNVFTATDGTNSYAYTVKLSRGSANVAPSVTVRGETLSLNKTTSVQTVFVDEIPAAASDIAVATQYPNGSTVSAVSYSSGTATFTVTDKINTSDSTNYSVKFETKDNACFAYWDCDTLNSGGREIVGKKWNGTAFVTDAALNMRIRKNANETAAVDQNSKASTVSSVSGVMGNAASFADWTYSCATLPAVTASGFTFSAWTKLSGDSEWEPFFGIYDRGYTKGALYEKVNMQYPSFGSNDVAVGHVDVSDAEYEEGMKYSLYNSNDAFVYVTITVSYKNDVGRICYYVNGKLLASYVDKADANGLAKNTMEALASGAQFGIRRHCWDIGSQAVYDEIRLYAYEMSAADVDAMYGAYEGVLAMEGSAYLVDGISTAYPDLLLDGAVSVTGSTVKTGVTQHGATYTYTAKTASVATKAEDTVPVQVTVNSKGITRVINMTYARAFRPITATVNFTAGATGSLSLTATGSTLHCAVPASVDLTAANAVTATVAVNMLDGDSTAANYHSSFLYNASTKRATVSVWYSDYVTEASVYTIEFVTVKTDASVLSVAYGTHELKAGDFTSNAAVLGVTDPASFSITLTVTVADGASVTGGVKVAENVYELAWTNASTTFTVVAQDGVTSTVYTLNAVSDDASLSALSVSGYTLSPAFSAAQTYYTVPVEAGVKASSLSSSVTATAAHGGSVQITYNDSSNYVIVAVTATDGVTKSAYIINVHQLDTVATLASLTVGGNAVKDFNPEVTAYDYHYTGTLADAAESVEAVATSASAHVAVGALSDSTVTVTVTAESGAVKSYVITFAPASSEKGLSSVTVNGTAVTLTDGAGTYAAAAGTKLNMLDVVAVASDSNATVAYEMDEAAHTICITVTAEDGSSKVYTVSVTGSAVSQISSEGGVTEDNAKSGCNSSLSFGMIPIVVAVLGAGGLVAFRKRKGE